MADITLSVKASDLNQVVNKATKQLDNITAEAKKEIAELSMPSDNRTLIQVDKSGSYWTATENGYLTARGTTTAGATGATIKLITMPAGKTAESDAIYFSSWIAVTASNAGGVTVPIRKGQNARYVYTVPSIELIFTKAEGEAQV